MVGILRSKPLGLLHFAMFHFRMEETRILTLTTKTSIMKRPEKYHAWKIEDAIGYDRNFSNIEACRWKGQLLYSFDFREGQNL